MRGDRLGWVKGRTCRVKRKGSLDGYTLARLLLDSRLSSFFPRGGHDAYDAMFKRSAV